MHKQTKSYGSSKAAKGYRKKLKEMIDNGDYNGAQQADIDDLFKSASVLMAVVFASF